MKPTDQYELDSAQIQFAIDVLRKEQQASELTRFQRVCYWLFQSCGYLFVGSFIVLLGAGIAGSQWLVDLTVVGAAVFGLLALVLLVLNLPLILKSRRRERVVSNLGLSTMLSGAWKSDQRQRRYLNVITATIAVIFLLLLVGALIVGIISIVEVQTRPTRGAYFGLSDILTALAFAAALFSIPLFLNVVRRRRDRHNFLMDIREIERSLRRYQDVVAGSASSRVSVPAAEVERIAEIERAQIANDRADSIKSFARKDRGGFALLPSREFHEAKNRLDSATNSRIDAVIDRLTNEPQPAEARRDPGSDGWLLKVPDTHWMVSYAVDRERNSLRLFRLLRTDETGLAH